MSKLSKIAAFVAVVPVLAFSAPVYADSPGDLAGGADIYQTRNTKSTVWGSTASAACGETVKYSVKLSNTDYGQITNILVKTSLTSGAMTATGTNAEGKATSTSGNVSVTLPAGGSLAYDTDFKTQLVSATGAPIQTLSGNVTAEGVTVDKLAGSTKEFVQFQAKVNCETPSQIKVCDLNTKKVVTINEKDFDSAKYSKDLTKCNATPTPVELVKTGPADTAAIVAGAVALATAGYAWVLRRQNAR